MVDDSQGLTWRSQTPSLRCWPPCIIASLMQQLQNAYADLLTLLPSSLLLFIHPLTQKHSRPSLWTAPAPRPWMLSPSVPPSLPCLLAFLTTGHVQHLHWAPLPLLSQHHSCFFSASLLCHSGRTCSGPNLPCIFLPFKTSPTPSVWNILSTITPPFQLYEELDPNSEPHSEYHLSSPPKDYLFQNILLGHFKKSDVVSLSTWL